MLGVIGASIGLIASAVAGAVVVVVFFILWKSGTLGSAWGVAAAFVSGLWAAVAAFFGFLSDLIGAF